MGTAHGGPATCPNGHPLAAPNVKVGWYPCACPLADPWRPLGHITYWCLTCRAYTVDGTAHEDVQPR